MYKLSTGLSFLDNSRDFVYKLPSRNNSEVKIQSRQFLISDEMSSYLICKVNLILIKSLALLSDLKLFQTNLSESM